MSDELQDIALIEAYLNEELDAQQRQAVEIRSNNDPAFAQLLADLSILFEGTREAYRQDIESQLQDIEADLPPVEIDETALLLDDIPKPIEKQEIIKPKPKYRKMRIGKWWYAAAILIPLLGLMTWVFWPETSVEERLFAEYFEMPKRKSIPRSNKLSLKEQGFDKYKLGEYNDAIPLFEQSFKDASDTESLFYLGISQLEKGRIDEAIKNLELLKDLNDIRFKDVSFYLALGYLRKGELDRAILELKMRDDILATKLKKDIQRILSK